MDSLVQLVGGYRERDKLIRLCQYVVRFLAGTGQTNMGARLSTIAQEFGKCRTVLRLFDDIPMLAYTLHYGLGKKVSMQYVPKFEVNHSFICSMFCCKFDRLDMSNSFNFC
jgi:peroxin-11C